MVQTKYYEDLPPIYCQTLNEIEGDLAREADPFRLSALLDGAMFRQAKAVLDRKRKTASSGSIFLCGRIT